MNYLLHLFTVASALTYTTCAFNTSRLPIQAFLPRPRASTVVVKSAIDDTAPSDFFAAAINGMAINGDSPPDITIITSEKEYDLALDFFMFELGNDIIFLDNRQEISKYIDRSFDTIIFQIKGVLLQNGDGKPITGALDAVKSLSEGNKEVLLLYDDDQPDKQTLRNSLNLIDVKDEQIISMDDLTSKKDAFKRTLMVVDRMDELKSAKELGLKLALVFTGITDAQDLIDGSMMPDEKPFPHLIFANVGMMKY